MPFGDKVDTGGTTVWIWTGDDEDTVDDDAELFRLDVSEDEAAEPPASISVTTEHDGEKAHLGSSVLYDVQLVDKNGDDVGNPDRWRHLIRGLTFSGVAQFNAADELVNTGGEFKVGDLPPYTVDVQGQGTPVETGQFAVADGVILPPTGSSGPVIFSTEAGVLNAGDIFVKVEPAAEFAVVDPRGADTRVTVTVTDQYGDPIPGIQVRVDSTDDSLTNDAPSDVTVIVVADRYLSVGRDGSFSFGYESFIEDSSLETLRATIAPFDHDGDGDPADVLESTAADVTPAQAVGQATVKWAVAATASEATEQQIRAFDTETNSIFVGGDTDGQFVTYDSNDRFNIDRPDPTPDDGIMNNPDIGPASYTAFEKALSKASDYELTWEINGRGSRATNVFNLFFPGQDPA